MQASERANPFWLSRWPELRQLLLADWSTATARARITLEERNTRRHHADLPIPRTLALLVFDHLLRWAAIGFFVKLQNGWLAFGLDFSGVAFTLETNDETNRLAGIELISGLIYVLISTLIIPLLVVGVASRWKRWQDSRLNRLCADHVISPDRLRLRTTPVQVAACVVLAVVYALMGRYYNMPVQVVLALLAYFPFLLLIYGQYSVGWLSAVQFRRLLAANEPPKSNWTADENDEAILGLEARLKAMNRRLESYVLESALFGALALSGFLQIIAEELISFDDVGQFTQQFSLALGHLFHFEGAAGWGVLVQLFGDKRSLFCLLCYESLFYAVAFLVVIAARLRFSDLADAIEQQLEVAHAFNDKEEQLGPEAPDNRGGENRRRWLNQKIRDQPAEAQAAFVQTEGPVAFTRFFRNLGVGAYFVMLVTAGFFLSPAVAVFFFGLWMLSQGFFALRQGRRNLFDLKLRLQELLLRHRQRINGATLLLILLGMVIKLEGGTWLGLVLWQLGCTLLLLAHTARYLLLPAPLGAADEDGCRRLTIAHRLLLVLLAFFSILLVGIKGPPDLKINQTFINVYAAGFFMCLLAEQAIDSLLSPRWRSLSFWGKVRESGRPVMLLISALLLAPVLMLPQFITLGQRIAQGQVLAWVPCMLGLAGAGWVYWKMPPEFRAYYSQRTRDAWLTVALMLLVLAVLSFIYPFTLQPQTELSGTKP